MQPEVIKQYKHARAFGRDALRWGAKGYEISQVNGQHQQVAITRTAINTLLTGGVGLVIGGRAHKGAQVLVTYRYVGAAHARASRGAYYLSRLPYLLILAAFVAGMLYLILH